MQSSLTKGEAAVTGFSTAAKAGMAGAAIAVGAFVVSAVGAARDLVESQNKVKVVFGDSAGSIEEWATTAATSMGISEQAALESAGTFGNLFDAMGIVDSAGAEMSKTLVGLAADLASFNNQDPTDVLQALQSGLTGQIRPLRQYGIEISDAALQQEAMAEGIKKSTSAMTLAEKVQLRYNLILKQTGNAQGDFQRTSDDLANQQRILAAQWEDLQATIGRAFLPLVLRVTHGLNDLATVLLFVTGQTKNFDQAVQEAAINVGHFELDIASWAEKFAGHIPIIGNAVQLWDNWRAAQDAAAAAGGLTANQIAIITRGLEQQGPSITAFRQHWQGVAKDFLNIPFFRVQGGVEDTGKAVRHFAELAGKDLKEWEQGVAETTRVTIGDFHHMNEAFGVTPKELRHQLSVALGVARTFQRDLRTIMTDKGLTQAQRAALAELPPEYRHAFVESKGAARQEIVRMATDLSQANSRTFSQITRSGTSKARSGGAQIGSALATGITDAINNRAHEVAAAAAKMVTDAITAANRAAATGSPSKKMIKLGEDMTEGLLQGLLKDQQKVVDGIKKLLQKVLDAARSFRDAIRGAFEGFDPVGASVTALQQYAEAMKEFLDAQAAGTLAEGQVAPTAPDLGAIAAAQVASARQFADVLRALEIQGASKQLLAQIAAQGPAGIGFAQGLLQGGPELIEQFNASLAAINKVAGNTADALTKTFFGERIDRLRDKLDKQIEILRQINQAIREEEKDPPVNVTVNGWVGSDQQIATKIAEEFRKQKLRSGPLAFE